MSVAAYHIGPQDVAGGSSICWKNEDYLSQLRHIKEEDSKGSAGDHQAEIPCSHQ